MRPLAIAALAILALVTLPEGAASTTFLFDDLSGGTSGSITGRNDVSFTPDSAAFSSSYDGNLFPAEGVIEVRLRVDGVAADPLAQPFDFGTIVNSAGVDARVTGDLFLGVKDSGLVSFVLAPIGGVDPWQQIQLESATSIIDGQFHVVGIQYGSNGIELRIDGFVEDSDGFTGLRC
jgi:hypothetical protein